MLALSRKPNQSIKIGENIEITVVEIRGNQVKLGISAPRDVAIVRDDAVKRQRDTKKSDCCGKCSGHCRSEVSNG